MFNIFFKWLSNEEKKLCFRGPKIQEKRLKTLCSVLIFILGACEKDSQCSVGEYCCETKVCKVLPACDGIKDCPEDLVCNKDNLCQRDGSYGAGYRIFFFLRIFINWVKLIQKNSNYCSFHHFSPSFTMQFCQKCKKPKSLFYKLRKTLKVKISLNLFHELCRDCIILSLNKNKNIKILYFTTYTNYFRSNILDLTINALFHHVCIRKDRFSFKRSCLP